MTSDRTNHVAQPNREAVRNGLVTTLSPFILLEPCINCSFFFDTGYPHDGRADKDSYPHDGRTEKDSYPHDGCGDKDSYPHDRHNQYIMLSL